MSVIVKRKYSILPSICSQSPLGFRLPITVEPSEFVLIESQLVSVLSGIFPMKLGCSITLQCDVEFPKMLPLCSFVPPGLAS